MNSKTAPNQSAAPKSSLEKRRADLYKLDETLACMDQVLNWVKEYWTQNGKSRVFPNTTPGQTSSQLPKTLPEEGLPLEKIFQNFLQDILPGLLHWNHPGFFGFFPCNTSGPSLLSAVVTTTLNVNPFSWNAGPSATELEGRVVRWLGQAIGLNWPGCLQDTASSATLCALIAARERQASSSSQGLFSQTPLVAYTSEEAHSSVVKAAFLAGMGRSAVRRIPTRDDLSMDPEALRRQIRNDKDGGLLPCFVCSTLGSTSSTAFDRVGEIAQVVAEECPKLWHHVDAALAGSAALLPEMQWMMEGVNKCDSFVFNPHKWLFTHFECSVLFVKNREEYVASLSEDPAYLQNHLEETDGDAPEDYRNWSLQLGRGFRGLKLWFVLQAYGLRELQNMLRSHLKLTQDLAQRFRQEPRFRLLATPQLNTICFACDTEEKTRDLHRALISRGRIYLTPTRIRGEFWLRVAVGQTAVQPEDIERLWEELCQASC